MKALQAIKKTSFFIILKFKYKIYMFVYNATYY